MSPAPSFPARTCPASDRPGMAPTLLTSAQAAREVGMSARTLSGYAADGVLVPASVLPSGHRRWNLDDLRAQLAALAHERAARED